MLGSLADTRDYILETAKTRSQTPTNSSEIGRPDPVAVG
jgi:hypothetical protein